MADHPPSPQTADWKSLGLVSLRRLFRSGGDEDEAARTGAVCRQRGRELPNLAAQAYLRLHEQVGGETFGGGSVQRAEIGDPGRAEGVARSPRRAAPARRDDGAARSLRLERRRQLLGNLRIASDDQPFANRRSLDLLVLAAPPAQLEPVGDRLLAGAFEMLGVQAADLDEQSADPRLCPRRPRPPRCSFRARGRANELASLVHLHLAHAHREEAVTRANVPGRRAKMTSWNASSRDGCSS